MKKLVLTIAAVLLAGVLFHAVADEVTPAGLELTCLRVPEISGNITTTSYWQGDTISFTNSVMYVGATTNTAAQNLDGCVITVTMGTIGNTNTTVATGYNISTNDGTWGAEMVVPAFNPCYIEVTVSNNAVYTYPRYRIGTKTHL